MTSLRFMPSGIAIPDLGGESRVVEETLLADAERKVGSLLGQRVQLAVR